MTFSYSLGGEHATCINGNGVDPQKGELLEVARQAGLDMTEARRILEEIEEIVSLRLGRYRLKN